MANSRELGLKDVELELRSSNDNHPRLTFTNSAVQNPNTHSFKTASNNSLSDISVEYVPVGKNSVLLALKVTFFVLSLGLATIYVIPAEECSDKPNCGEWLKDVVGAGVADVIFFISGSGTATLTGGFYGAQSIDKIIEIFGPLNRNQRMWRGAGTAALTMTQLGHIFITAATTHSNFWEIITSVGGFIPPALFTAVNLPSELPTIKAEVKKLFMQLQHATCWRTPEVERYMHYFHQQQSFNQRLINNWKNIREKLAEFKDNSIILDNEELDFIFFNSDSDVDETVGTKLTNLLKLLGISLGDFMAAALSYVVIENAADYFHETNDFLSYMLAVAISLSALYTNFKIIPSSVSSFIQTVCHLVRGVPLGVHFYTNRKITITGSLLASSSLLSYSLGSTSADNVLTPDRISNEAWRLTLRLSSMMAICWLHYGGSIQFTDICASIYNALVNDQSAMSLERAEKKVADMLKMPVDEFSTLVENFSPEQLKLFGIRPFFDLDRTSTLSERLNLNSSSILASAQAAERASIDEDFSYSPPPSRSWWQSSLSVISSLAGRVRDKAEEQPIFQSFTPYLNR